MRYIIALLLALIGWTDTFAQKTLIYSEILAPKQVESIFSKDIRRALHINFPICKAFKYEDNSGLHYCILTESREKQGSKDTINHNIKALFINFSNGNFAISRQIDDHITKNDKEEVSISFAVQYIEFIIRHQNSTLDYERETQVDKRFYELPPTLQVRVKQKMEWMVKNDFAIFSAGWQKAMQNKKIDFNERKR